MEMITTALDQRGRNAARAGVLPDDDFAARNTRRREAEQHAEALRLLNLRVAGRYASWNIHGVCVTQAADGSLRLHFGGDAPIATYRSPADLLAACDRFGGATYIAPAPC